MTLTAGNSPSGIYRSRDAICSAQPTVAQASDAAPTSGFIGALGRPGGALLWSTDDVFERGPLGRVTRVNNLANSVTSACRVVRNLS